MINTGKILVGKQVERPDGRLSIGNIKMVIVVSRWTGFIWLRIGSS
jgi:hypothetical protein